MELDMIADRIGNFGLWQARLVGILGLCGFFNAFQKVSLSFIMKKSEFWCTSESIDRASRNLTQCQAMDENETITACTQWDYDRETYPETAVTQYNLVCGEEYWIQIIQSVLLFGYLAGSLISGLISDKFGRKPAIIISAWFYLIFSTLSAFSPSIACFCLFRFWTAFFAISLYNVTFTYCVEIVGGNWITFVTVLYSINPSLGFVLTPLLSWIFPRWTNLQLAITGPILLITLPLCVPGFLPESPRWLSANGYSVKAEAVIKKAAETNTLPCKLHLADKQVTEDLPKGSLRDLFITPGICRSTLAAYFIWGIVLGLYNFVLMNIGEFIPGSQVVKIGILASFEIIFSLVSVPVIVHIKRRSSLSFFLFFTGIALLLTRLFKNPTLRQAFNLAANVSNVINFNIMMVFTSEIYPTVIRNIGLGTANCIGYVAGAAIPLILPMLRSGDDVLLFGTISILAGFLVWILPETKGLPLIDSLKDGEELNRNCGGIPHFSMSEFRTVSPEVTKANGSSTV